MRIGNLHPAAGATRPSKRRGKGAATGLGGTAGKGHKGHKARTGGKIPSWFEGGQMPVQRRLPKRGFKNPTRVEYQVVAVGRLDAVAAGTTVDREWLRRAGLARRAGPVKLLGGGEIKAALTVQVDAASASARRAVEAAGGRVETPPEKPAAAGKKSKAKKA
jgi:large subunit ribosomal protein L15